MITLHHPLARLSFVWLSRYSCWVKRGLLWWCDYCWWSRCSCCGPNHLLLFHRARFLHIETLSILFFSGRISSVGRRRIWLHCHLEPLSTFISHQGCMFCAGASSLAVVAAAAAAASSNMPARASASFLEETKLRHEATAASRCWPRKN